eukprot:4000159-Prorocentrum_lima.AAC.1
MSCSTTCSSRCSSACLDPSRRAWSCFSATWAWRSSILWWRPEMSDLALPMRLESSRIVVRIAARRAAGGRLC